MTKLNRFFSVMGIQTAQPKSQIFLAILGGSLSLMVITWISWVFLGKGGAISVVPSMGAATLLLFVVPHAPLSQPWALFIGNTVSAIIGVTVARLVPDLAIASGLAVGLAIGAMILTRSTHPPGGATALAAVLGGTEVQQLGYMYLFFPVLLNCIVIFVFAILFNNLFGWRRYPLGLMPYKFVKLSPEAIQSQLHLNCDDFRAGLAKLEITVDITVEQLEQVYLNALQHKEEQSLEGELPKAGELYSNNKPGAHWSVRKIIEIAYHPEITKQLVVYKTIEGDRKDRVDSCSLIEFKRWANVKASPC